MSSEFDVVQQQIKELNGTILELFRETSKYLIEILGTLNQIKLAVC